MLSDIEFKKHFRPKFLWEPFQKRSYISTHN